VTIEHSAVRRIVHIDMDAFYASVEQRDNPSLRGKPVAVGGDADKRGVVAAASYEARKYGIHSAMASAHAVRRCPDLVFLKPDFTRYRKESEAIFAIFHDFTPLVQPASLDEAYLDVSEHLGPWGSATAIAREIRRRVREERRLTVSVGVGPNRLVAKIASDFDKPDGLTVVKPAQVESFLAPLPVRRLHGVGPATEQSLAELGVTTVAELRKLEVAALTQRFGKWGEALHQFARGIDDRPVSVERERKSVGTETTYARDLDDPAAIEAELARHAGEVAEYLQKRQLLARTVTIKVRYADFTTVTRGHTFVVACCDESTLAWHAVALMRRTDAAARPVRLLGVTASNLLEGAPHQLPLFGSYAESRLVAEEAPAPGEA
jgi:DNA polymerase-4